MATKEEVQARYEHLKNVGRTEDAQKYIAVHGPGAGVLPSVPYTTPKSVSETPIFQRSPEEFARYLSERRPANVSQLIKSYEGQTGKKVPEMIVLTSGRESTSAPTEQAQKTPFIYEGQVPIEQASALRQWAAERGARVEFTGGMSTMQGEVTGYRIISKEDIEAKQEAGRQLQAGIEAKIFGQRPPFIESKKTEGLVISLPAPPTREQRFETELRSRAAKIHQEAKGDIVKTAQLQVMAATGAKSIQYFGSLITGADTEYIVTKDIERELKLYTTETPSQRFGRKVEEYVYSVPGTITTAVGVGAVLRGGLAIAQASKYAVLRAAAPKVGAGLAALGVASTGVEVYGISQEKDTTIAVGRSIRLAGAIVGGLVGYKLGAPKPEVTDIKVDLSQIKGASKTRLVTEEKFISGGAFKVETLPKGKTEPFTIKGLVKTKGIIGEKTTRTISKIKIPKQVIKTKTGKITVKEQYIYTGQKATPLTKTLTRIKSVSKGTSETKGYVWKTGEIKSPKTVTRIYEGVTGTTEYKNVNVKGLMVGDKLYLKTTKTGATPTRLSTLDWVDVVQKDVKPSAFVKITGKITGKAAGKPRTGKVLSDTQLKTAPALEKVGPSIPSGKISLKGVQATTAKTVTPSVLATASLPAGKQIEKIAKSVLPEVRTRTATRTAQKTSIVLRTKPEMATKQVTETISETDVISYPISTTVPTVDIQTDIRQTTVPTQRFYQPTETTTKTPTGTVTPTPVPPPVVETPTPTLFPGLPLPLALKFSGIRKTRYRTGVIINPIPKTLKVSLPKLKV